MTRHRRTDRLNRQLREELSRLVRTELKDPRVRTATITEVVTTPDLAHATVYVRTLDDSVSPDEAIRGLESAQGFLRRTLGRELRIRRIPEFRFTVDRTLEQAGRIEALLDEARKGSGDSGGG